MTGAPVFGRHAGLLLIFIAIFPFFFNFAGIGSLAILGGLLWSRRLRPFSRTARIGYWLCWLHTLVPAFFLPRAFFGSQAFNFEYQIAGYLLSAGVWLLVFRRWARRPARSIGEVFLVAFVGMLFLGPALVLTSVVTVVPRVVSLAPFFYMMPTIAVVPWAILVEEPNDIGLWPQVIMALGPASGVFLAFLAAYWPVRDTVEVNETGS